jgi:hypothetical protein
VAGEAESKFEEESGGQGQFLWRGPYEALLEAVELEVSARCLCVRELF